MDGRSADERADHELRAWHDEVRDLQRVEPLLSRIAQRAVELLDVEVAVASAGADRAGPAVRRAYARAARTPVNAPPALQRGRVVATPSLAAPAWWAARPGAWPAAVVVDLASGPGPVPGAERPCLELHAGADFFGPDHLLAAARFGAYASLTLLAVERIAHLSTALETRGAISQAQGMLMERFGLDAAAAMGLLRRWSRDANRPVRDLAAEVTRGDTPHPRPPSGVRQQWMP